ncbi:MAG TPA: protein kinase, partial [Gemmataceae bacterium]|nr:protein kinase [Gemmataceae bacterium]
EVREVFTSGGRGLVYRVRHRGWNMDLAVKCPRPEYFHDELDKEDFEQEAETWVKLGLHPHTVACYYVRRLGGIPRVFAEFVAGGSLDEWVRTRRLYHGGPEASLERVLDVAIQIAWGLQHAHDQNLVHRDVKPGNVLLTAEGLAKVTDFGMAKARGGRAETALGAGGASILVSAGGMTPAYCSPEQAQGHAVSRKTDVWSWGVSVLAMFTGGTQWSAGFLAGLALEEYLQRGPAEGLPRMPGDVADLLRQCFRRGPDDRPRDMHEVAAVLQDVYAQLTGGPYRRKPPHAAKALADGLNNRAVSLRDLHKLDEAERLWEEALAAGPHHPESTYNLGLTRWRGGRLGLEALLQQLQEVGVSHPGDWLPVYLTAMVHLEQGNWSDAVAALEKVGGAGAGQEEVRTALAAASERLTNTGHRVRTFRGHTGWASSACASADGRWALSGSADGTLKLWEAATGRCLQTFAGHTEWVTSVGLSADGRRAVSGSADRTLRLWDVGSCGCLRTFRGHTNWVLAAALSPDGRHALSASGDCLLKVWDTETGECVRSLAGHSAAVLSACWSADGRHALSGSRDRTLIWWDAHSGESLRQLAGHADKVHAVALSGDGRLALSGGADRALRLWDVESGECLQAFEGHQGGVTAVGLSADGRHAVSGGEDRAIKFWRPASGRCVCTLEGHAGTVHSVCLSGGRHALSASADQTLALWRLPPDLTAPYLLSRVLPSDTALAAWTDYERALARAKQALAAGDAARAARYLREARSQPGYGRRPEAMGQWSGLYVRLARK